MTLTENGKKYIATTFGNSSKCYVGTGLSWSYLGTDNQTYNESGGTAQIVSRLIMASLVQSITFNGQTFTYTALKTANDNTDLALSDAQWIAQNDGTPAGETQYCQIVIVTGSISCITTPVGAAVALDGMNQSGVTPVTLADVPAGPHTVTFTLSGYETVSAIVDVVAGSTTIVSSVLHRIVTGAIRFTGTITGTITGEIMLANTEQ